MKEEVKVWWQQAKSDLGAAHNSLSSKNYDWASFQAQQAAEKGLKALHLQEKKELRKIHDLTFFARELKLPEELYPLCIKLNKAYTEARYPDSFEVPAELFSEKEAKLCLNAAEVILKWIEKKLSLN